MKPQSFGDWTIERRKLDGVAAYMVGFRSQTVLFRLTMATLHTPPGTIVMEDSAPELRKHLPIWMAAEGRVLVTGLGLGCVVRGLLAKPHVDHIDVVEIDTDIIRVIGPEFDAEPRVSIHRGDALTIKLDGSWDFAWHDLWTEEGDGRALHLMHAKLLKRYQKRVRRQGAWAFPREFRHMMARGLGAPLLGMSIRPRP